MSKVVMESFLRLSAANSSQGLCRFKEILFEGKNVFKIQRKSAPTGILNLA